MQAVEIHLSRYVILRNSRNDGMTLRSQMKALGVPAVSIAAIRHGAIDWAQAYGVSSLHGAPVTTETLFGAASISKAVTALGVLKLVELGKINLDANVNVYLKRWKIPENDFTARQKVTVRELLNHTSGIGTHNGEIYDSSAPIPTVLQLLEGEKPARTPPIRVEAVPGTGYDGGVVRCIHETDGAGSGRHEAQYLRCTTLSGKSSKCSHGIWSRWKVGCAAFKVR
jgi:hypothetical protein